MNVSTHHRPARGWPRAVLAGLVASLTSLATAQTATFPIQQPFTTSTVTGWTFGGGAVLTGNGTTDPNGNGWLRLTNNSGNQTGYAFYNTAFSSAQGVMVDFDFTSWGGTGADGISFFLLDGATATPTIGAFGGSLGYAQKTNINGVSNGYVGIGLDEFGNYSSPTEGRVGGPGAVADAVAIRGPGNGAATTDYPYLTGAAAGFSLDVPSVATRPSQTGTNFRHARLIIQPNRATSVLVTNGFGATPTPVISNYTLAATPPSIFKLGFGASTGGSTNYHEIRNLSITAPTDLSITKTDGVNSLLAGGPVTYTITVRNNGQSPVSGAVVVDTVPASIGSVTWTCNASAGGACAAASGSGNAINTTADLAAGGTATYVVKGVVDANASGPISNTATVTPPATLTDLNTADNSATDTDTVTYGLAGQVFEDVNYGGGAGRNFGAAAGVGRPNARVELYNSSGAFVAATTTDASGRYGFTAAAGSYTVRVVNSTVTASRSLNTGTAYTPLAVQTFRTNGGADDTARVGGESPQLVDSGANTTSLALSALSSATTAAQSVSSVTVGSGSSASGVDFGYNFDTVVNKNDAGQGSLRQFIQNADALSGADSSVFMVADGLAHPGLRAGLSNQLSASGVASIVLASSLPDITDANTTIDGASQTVNVGNTNAATLGTTQVVGTGADGRAGSGDEPSVVALAAPEVEINGNRQNTALRVNGTTDVMIKNVAVTNTAGTNATAGVVINNAQRVTLSQNAYGIVTALADPGAGKRVEDAVVLTGSNTTVSVTGSVFGYLGHRPILAAPYQVAATNSGLTVQGNQFYYTGQEQSCAQCDGEGIILYDAWSSVAITQNLYDHIASVNPDNAIEVFYNSTSSGGGSGLLVQDNTIRTSNGVGITILDNSADNRTNSSGKTALISHNVITGTLYSANGGDAIEVTAQNVRISQNAVYANARLGIDLGANFGGGGGYGVSPNDGLSTAPLGNTGQDYPVLTGVTLSGSTLSVGGYVGTPTGTGFDGKSATIELFKANDDGNQNGAVIVGDGKSVGHGEGQTYLGTLTVTLGTNGAFSGSISTALLAVGDVVTSTATIAANTSEFGANAAVQVVRSVSGSVYEDPNYGGGAGRSLSASAGVGRPNVRVELYNSAGNFVSATLTDAGGAYAFNGLVAAGYTVRVVNAFVTSSRGGGCAVAVDLNTPPAACAQLPVQTFVNGDVNRVGGEDPTKVDPALSSTTLPALAQSRASVTLSNANVTGVDFGYNFDAVVNTNTGGQGSLSQFITNANALSNTNLAQSGNRQNAGVNQALPAGVESSIFMISDGAAHPGLRAGLTNQLTGGVAVISQTSDTPAISGANAGATSVDASTQTVNVGNTNPGTLGTGGTVGYLTTATLGTVQKPEVQLVGTSARAVGLDVQASNVQVRGLSLYGFGNGANNDNNANIRIGNDYTGTLIEQNIIGSPATSFNCGASTTAALSNADNIRSVGADSGTVQNNLIGCASGKGFGVEGGSVGWLITNNEIRGNGIGNTNLDGIDLENAGSQNHVVRGNLIANNAGVGVDGYAGSGGNLIEQNTIVNNGFGQGGAPSETAGVRLYSTGNTVQNNVIALNYGAGVMVVSAYGGNLISKNSIYDNGTLAAANGAAASGQIGIDLLSSTDNVGLGTTPFVTKNDAGDADTGGNGLLNFPVFESAVIDGANLVLKGYARPGSTIELFIAAPDGSGFGEGKTYLGTVKEGSTADLDAGTGTYSDPNAGTDTTNRFQFSVALPAGVAVGTRLTATASCLGSDCAGTTVVSNSTSEFSYTVAVQAGAPQISLIKYVRNIGPNLAAPAAATFSSASATGNPGDYLEYCVAYSNAGNAAALNLIISDPLAAATLGEPSGYASGVGIRLAPGASITAGTTNATPAGSDLTSADDPPTDAGKLTSSALSVNVGTLPVGGKGVVCFRAKIR